LVPLLGFQNIIDFYNVFYIKFEKNAYGVRRLASDLRKREGVLALVSLKIDIKIIEYIISIQ
jgi:hypothetical protein